MDFGDCHLDEDDALRGSARYRDVIFACGSRGGMLRFKRIGIVRHQRTLIRRPIDVVQDDFPLVITHIRRKDCRQRELRTRLRVNDFALRPRCTLHSFPSVQRTCCSARRFG